VVMEWKIGPIEVISLVVFVGYSVTYSLHIAHNYVEVSCSDPECERLEMEFIAKERRRACVSAVCDSAHVVAWS